MTYSPQSHDEKKNRQHRNYYVYSSFQNGEPTEEFESYKKKPPNSLRKKITVQRNKNNNNC